MFYQTAARRYLEDFFRTHPDAHFTTQQICLALSKNPASAEIGKSTVYRQLSRMCAENKLRRFEEKDPLTGAVTQVYQSTADGECLHHFHLKCTVCGRVQHLDCERTDRLLLHMISAHGFSVDCGRSLLYGICRDCAPRRLPFRAEPETSDTPSRGEEDPEPLMSEWQEPTSASERQAKNHPAAGSQANASHTAPQSQNLPDWKNPEPSGKEPCVHVH